MAQNVADDLWFGASIDLASRMAVTEDVTADHLCENARFASVPTDLVAQHAGGERAVGKPPRHEQFTRRDTTRTAFAEIARQCPRNLGQEWQLEGDTRLGPTSTKNSRAPVDVVESKAHDLASAKTIGCHQQEHGVVAQTDRLIAWNGTKNSTNRLPWKRPRWLFVGAEARGDYARREIALHAAGGAQEAQEASQRATQSCHSPSGEPRGQRIDEPVDVLDSQRRNGSAMGPHFSKKV